jgi:hypothetical protein
MNPQWIMNEGHPEGTVHTKDLEKSLNLPAEGERREDEERMKRRYQRWEKGEGVEEGRDH